MRLLKSATDATMLDSEPVALGYELSPNLIRAIDTLFKRNSIGIMASKVAVSIESSLGPDSTANKIIQAFANGLEMAP